MTQPLLDLFQLDELDVAANRAGKLSPTQHDRMADRVRKMTIISAGACFLFVLAALARGADGQWLLIAPVTVLVVTVVVVGLRARRQQFGPVTRLTGPVAVTSVSEDAEGARATRLVVDGRRCKVMGQTQRRDVWREACGDGDYDVYVVGKNPIIVAAEPVSTGAATQ